MKAKIYIGAKKYALYIGRKIVQKTLEFLTLPARFISKKVQDLKNYQVYGESKQSILPDGYTQLEYIESTGAQYIDTGVLLNNNSKVDLTLKYISSSIGSAICIFGYRLTASGPNKYAIWVKNSTGTYAFNFGSVDTGYLDGVIATDKAKLTMSKDGFYYNDTLLLENRNTSVFENNNTALICAMNTDSGLDNRQVNMQIFGCKIWKDGSVLTQNLLPARRNSDGVVGMYDLVSNTFLTNAGNGKFIAGNIAQPTPTTPIPVESVGDKTVNLFNPNAETFNGYIDPTGVGTHISYGVSTATKTYKKITYLKAGTYTYSFNNSPIRGTVRFHICNDDEINLFVANVVVKVGYNSATITTDVDGWVYITTVIGSDNIQLEEGSQATPYEPYYDGYKIPVTVSNTTTSIYLDQPLRKIGEV